MKGRREPRLGMGPGAAHAQSVVATEGLVVRWQQSAPLLALCFLCVACGAHVDPLPSHAVPDRTMPYSIVRIEMEVRDKKIHDKEKYSGFDFLDRMSAAGPSAAPELAFALESQDKRHRSMAGYALGAMLHWGWPEAWNLLMKRLGELPPAAEAGHLLDAATKAHINYI